MKKCGLRCEIWSRVSGYYRPVSDWNRGKKEEFKQRKKFRAAEGFKDEDNPFDFSLGKSLF